MSYPTVWFVIPAINEVAFRAIYDNENVRGNQQTDLAVDERIGKMAVVKTGNLMTGTTRMSGTARSSFGLGAPVWVEIFTSFPPPSSWEPQDPP